MLASFKRCGIGMKTLCFRDSVVGIKAPESVSFDTEFDLAFYSLIYDRIISGSSYQPVLDADLIYQGYYGLNLLEQFHASGLKLKSNVSKKAENRERLTVQYIIREFVNRYPEMQGLIANTVVGVESAIANAEFLYGAACDAKNFIEIKGVIDEVNRSAWTRTRDGSESQSGVSILGSISEALLNIIFDRLVDNKTFFKVTRSDVQSYGDFVLSCLPNNLWISVKSNFARERLLASGFSNDILGVGFFQEAREFSSLVRVRNFQRAGFLAMYCPDVAVSEEQLRSSTSTYEQIAKNYHSTGTEMPTNINGKPFIRKLSQLYDDLEVLLSESDLRKRTIVSY